MGIYDREYYRTEPEPGSALLGGPRSMTVTLILVTVAVFLVDFLLGRQLTEWCALKADALARPWLWWQTLSYGFLHSQDDVWHIVINMFVLWMFGRPIEQDLGPREFLRFYLAAMVFAGLVWTAFWTSYGLLVGPLGDLRCVGASGAIAGIWVLFALRYPNVTILLFFVLPMKAWVAGLLWLALDLYGAFFSESNVAHSAHLAGMAFALAYDRLHWNLGQWNFTSGLGRLFRRRPRLRFHPSDDAPDRIAEEVDRILDKIYREGEASLTPKERRKLHDYSRKLNQRRRGE